ncbi:MAG: hypothetical protein OYH77_02025 [Pseudomonadota bacterium]|nr:hypothetical protein [Pseudomonadota bacterium]
MKVAWIITIMVLAVACGGKQDLTSETKAVHDVQHVLGLQAMQVVVDGKQVEAYQFLLCDRSAMREQFAMHELMATSPVDRGAIDTSRYGEIVDGLLGDKEICYNPFVAKNSEGNASSAVFITMPDTKSLERNKLLRNVAKAGLVAGGAVVLTASVLLGIKSWRLFIRAEEYIRYFNRAAKAAKRAKALQKLNSEQQRRRLLEKFSKEDRHRLKRIAAWLAGGGIVASTMRWFIFADGGFHLYFKLFDLNKKYFDDGRKVLYTWGSAEEAYLNNYQHLTNDEWQYTAREHSGVYHLLVGIKKDLDCEFSARYKKENPLLRDE